MTEEHTTVCYRHPARETTLRCNRCSKPICADCARRTPTGYRCPDCIREQKRVFDTAQPQDFILGFLSAAVLSLIGGLLMRLVSGIGFFFIFFIVAIGTGAGVLIADLVRRVINKRRSRPLFITIAAGVALGGLAASGDTLLYILLTGDLLGGVFGLLWPGIYVALATATTYMRLSGIQLNR
jgi:hypothetical protein